MCRQVDGLRFPHAQETPMIRITIETQTSQEVVLKVEGNISEHTVEVL